MKKKILSLTAKDFRWDYYNGTGKGGQNRNKNKNCVRCFHDPSGAMGNCQEHKSLEQNKKVAFTRMANSDKFRNWLRIESMKRAGDLASIEHKVDMELIKNTVVETKNDQGKWQENKELEVSCIDTFVLKNKVDNSN